MAQIVGVRQGEQILSRDEVTNPIKDNIRQAREHRKKFEPTWQSNMAFAAGQHWLVWDDNFRALRSIRQMDPAYKRRELYTSDQITKYRTQALGELGSDDDRPSLLLQRDDKASEDYQKAINKALGYGWDFEWDGDGALDEADQYCVDLGTSAIQCYYDPSTGPTVAQDVPHLDGRPLLDPTEATSAVAASVLGGPKVVHKPMRAGKICWRPLSALNLLPPPGVTNEKYFNWECVVRPMPLDTVKATFGDIAANLEEDRDISSSLGDAAVGPNASNYSTNGARANTLRGHVWLFTYFERSTKAAPEGRVFHFAGNGMRLLRIDDRLPYVAPDGSYRSGIAYFHWWRVTGRFWSRSLVEALKDGQRSHNKRRTQSNEIIDRSLPAIFVDDQTYKAARRQGIVNELISIPAGARQPQPWNGHGPGPWMKEDIDQIRQDMTDASTIQAPTLGENPANVTTFGQLSLLREADQVKRSKIVGGRKLAIKQLVEDTVYDMRTYWGPQKQIMLAGDEDKVESEIFNATQIPPFFIVKIAKGAAKPRSEAAEIQKVQDVWNAALNSQAVARRPDPWVKWFKDSLEAGQVLDLPDDPSDAQGEKAELENHILLQGSEVNVAYYDDPTVHIPIHRDAQVEAEMSGDVRAVQTIEFHIQAHLNMAQHNADLAAAQQMPMAPPATPGAETSSPSPSAPGSSPPS